MKKLQVYPTSRALRKVSSEFKSSKGFLPTLMRMDEFEHRAVILPDKSLIDPLQRILLLRKAADFRAFGALKVNRELIRFFTKSDALFKFFEELAQENVDFDTLAEADAYAEFASHLDILKQLLENYRALLDKQGMTDKAFVPGNYKLNRGFLQGYHRIDIYLEGYLSHFEMELIHRISLEKELYIHMETSRFNRKMQERFEAYGIGLPKNSFVSFNFGKKNILEAVPNTDMINAKVYSVQERYEQIGCAFEKIDKMVQAGIRPESIALVLPDESIKEAFELYDAHRNLNFAMGFDYTKSEIYQQLEILYHYWQHFDKESRSRLERYRLDVEKIDLNTSGEKISIGKFFTLLDGLSLLDCPLKADGRLETDSVSGYSEKVYERYLHFLKIFEKQILSGRDWLFVWMKALSDITTDDVRGGLITVMGVLETRGVAFDGVVIVDFNEGVVPASSSKDQFLNSSVRTFAHLPTLGDREALQKQYYKCLLEQAEKSVIIYSTAENRLPSKFLYELELERAVHCKADLTLLYRQKSQTIDVQDPVVEHFDAHAIEWSASRLKTYLECKRKYYYRYIQKIKPKKEEELNEGSFLHLLLDHLYRDTDHYLSADEMKKSLDRLMDRLLPQDDARLAYQKLLWREKLKGYIEAEIAHFEEGWRVVSREYEVRGEIDGLPFKGRIDRIDQRENETVVIDYKSGSIKEANKSKNLETLSDYQMSIYDQLLTGRYQNMTLAFMQILEGGRLEKIASLKEKNKLLTEHIAELKQTRQFTASRCEELHKCQYCEFALMCERGDYL